MERGRRARDKAVNLVVAVALACDRAPPLRRVAIPRWTWAALKTTWCRAFFLYNSPVLNYSDRCDCIGNLRVGSTDANVPHRLRAD